MAREEAGSSEAVGYGKPPKKHQFKKGKSGNPRGRPPKVVPASMKELIQRRLDEEIEVTIGGQIRRMSRREAVVERHISDVLGGKKGAVKALDELAKLPIMSLPEPPPGYRAPLEMDIAIVESALEMLEREMAHGL